jgi:hypothetical protein
MNSTRGLLANGGFYARGLLLSDIYEYKSRQWVLMPAA